MAASIYATPPPDLSSEDTALSDVSNSSTLNTNRGSSSNSHTHEATAAATATATATAAATTTTTTTSKTTTPSSPTEQMEMDVDAEPTSKPALGSNTTDGEGDGDGDGEGEGEGDGDGDDDDEETETEKGQTAMAAMAAAANAAMQLQLLEALSDAAKKRRKQHNPSRLEALNLSGGEEGEAAAAAAASVDYEEKLSKMLLPKSIEKLKDTFALLQQQQQQEQQQLEPKLEPAEETTISETQQPAEEEELLGNPYQTFCKQCGENFETDYKLSLHMLQEHGSEAEQGQQQQSEMEDEVSPMDFLASVKVKLERADSPPVSQHEAQHRQRQQQEQELEHERQLANGAKEHWLNVAAGMPPHPGMASGFPLAAGSYLPLLGMPGFPGVDGLNRPPLRIFNPEAYCELCNKEFCNKYFLKTHKANKHGIYDPIGDATAGNNNNNNSTSSNNNNNNQTTNQIYQLQMPRESVKPPVESHHVLNLNLGLGQSPAQQLTPPAPPPVHCDICAKRFTNVFAMRRHRAKVHDQNSPPSSSSNSSSRHQEQPSEQPQSSVKQEPQLPLEAAISVDPKPFQMPEGFREDFTLEQEEVSFAPPPRKMAPQQQQQAREASFAHEKLRRLGVQQPEAFCELCCKEYCNKYFLRTHKWKRHGVFVPPEELKEKEPEPDQQQLQLAQKMAWPFMNLPGMPLNLMLANEKARLLAAAAAATESAQSRLGDEQPPGKRIKLEQPDSSDTADLYDSLPAGNAEQLPPNSAAEEGSAIGLQNLQKLQSMLQQLNDFNGKRPLPCHLCGRELEHQYALQAHLMTEHAGMHMQLDNGNPLALYQQQPPPPPPIKLSPNGGGGGGGAGSPAAVDLRCQQCEREFGSPQEFKQHIAEVHLLASSPIREGFYTPERPTNSNSNTNPNPNPSSNPSSSAAPPTAARPSYTITPTSSYCEICNKELCNKYFMKTHMQRMHGIEIENGAQIGGVVCNICNKELCSKYFLRVHKHNTHGIIEDGAPLPQPRGIKFEAQQQQQQQLMEQELARGQNLSPHGNAPDSSGSGNSGGSGSSSYNELCPLCSRHFRSAKWLRTHLLNDHGAAGSEKLRELEQQPPPPPAARSSKPNSPTLKIPNGAAGQAAPSVAAAAAAAAAAQLPNPANLAQALQNLNAQHLLGQMPKSMLPGMFGAAVAEQAALQSPRFKEYQCSMCPFSTPYYAFLFIHERSHALLNSNGNGNGNGAGDLANSQAALAEAEAEAELPKADRAFALIQGKARGKSIRAADEHADHVEPTNLTKPRTPTPTTPTTPSPKATPSSPQNQQQNQLAAVVPPSPKPRSRSASATPKPGSQNGAGAGAGAIRSAATSPFELCSDLANGSGKPVSYALPDSSIESYQMQAFHMTAAADAEGLFAPAMVYLPVRGRLTEPTTLTFKLTPA